MTDYFTPVHVRGVTMEEWRSVHVLPGSFLLRQIKKIASYSLTLRSVFSDSQIKFCEATEGDTGCMTVMKSPLIL